MTESPLRDVEVHAPARPDHGSRGRPRRPDAGTRPAPKPLSVLFLAANPAKTNELALGEEARLIRAKLQAGTPRLPPPFDTRWAVRVRDLQEVLLTARPTLVHFSGHGTGTAGLMFHGEGGAASVSSEALQDLFAILRDDIRVVLLNACYSEVQAAAISSQVDVVIGMHSQVRDRAALLFAEAFYQALAHGRTVGTAFDLGVNAIKLDGETQDQEIDSPVMLARGAVDPYKLSFALGDSPSSRRIIPALALALGAVAALSIVAYVAMSLSGHHEAPRAASLPPRGRYDCWSNDRLLTGCEIARGRDRLELVFSTPESDDVLVHRIEGVIIPSGEDDRCWSAAVTTSFSDGSSPVQQKPGGTITCCAGLGAAGCDGHWISADGAARGRFRMSAPRGER